MPIGFPLVAGWYLTPGLKGFFALPMLPGGMIGAGGGVFFMIVTGWVAFNGTPPL